MVKQLLPAGPASSATLPQAGSTTSYQVNSCALTQSVNSTSNPTVRDEHVLQSSMSHCSGSRVHLSNPHTENAILAFYVKASGGGGIEIYLGPDEIGRRGAHRGISVALCKSRKRSHTLALSIHEALTTYQHWTLGLSAFKTVSQMCAYSSPGIHHRDLHTLGPH